jgi:hypothetical protein
MELQLAGNIRAGERDLAVVIEHRLDRQARNGQAEGAVKKRRSAVPDQKMEEENRDKKRQDEHDENGLFEGSRISRHMGRLRDPEDPVGLGRDRLIDEDADPGDHGEREQQGLGEEEPVRGGQRLKRLPMGDGQEHDEGRADGYVIC